MSYLQWNRKTVARLNAEGRGKGRGKEYKPWFYIGEVRTSGRTHDPTSELCQRPHQLISDQEYYFYLLLCYSKAIRDVREQYPLDLDLTLQTASDFKVPHPCYDGTGDHQRLTVDFLATFEVDGKLVDVGFDVKWSAHIEVYRTLEKLEIVRESLARSGLVHRIVPHTELPMGVVANLAWFHGGQLRRNEAEIYPGYFEEHVAGMLDDIRTTDFRGTLKEYCHRFASRHGMARETAIKLARTLLSRRVLEPDDLGLPQLVNQPLPRFKLNRSL